MATTTMSFGKPYRNSSRSIWSIRRQILMIPYAKCPVDAFVAGNILSSATISVPLRGSTYELADGAYTDLVVAVWKGLVDTSIIDSTTENKNWFVGNTMTNNDQSDINMIAKANSSSITTYGFQYSSIHNETASRNIFIKTPLLYFHGDPVIPPSTDTVVTFTNPVITEEGRRLENWMPSQYRSDYDERLFVGVYHNSPDVTWPAKNSSYSNQDLNWVFPYLPTDSGYVNQYAELTLNYGSGLVKYYTGSEWKDCQPFYYTGSEWKTCSVQYYTGNEWKTIG